MKFVLKPSLQHMAIVKSVVSLWNKTDVRDLIMKYRPSSNFSTRYEKWNEVEERVIEKVALLSLPQLLKEKVSGLIKPIGLEILMWKEYHRKHFHVNLPPELCWTPQGTVDRKRTAEILISDVNLDMSTRYKVACIYCIEDDIHKLWNSMPENLKESDCNKFPIINFWSHNMKRRESGNEHIDYSNQFWQSVCWINTVAAEYFLLKLTPRETEESLKKAVKFLTDARVLHFLISVMNEKQQMEVFKNNPFEVLQSLLTWPLQSFYIETANCMWDFLSAEDLNCLLMCIVHKVDEGYRDWNYQELFREFWQESPNAKKSVITSKIDKSCLLPALFHIKDKENIRLILKDINFTEKEKLIYNYGISDMCERSIHYNEWDILKFFIQECLPSKNVMLKFKEEFEKRLYFQECLGTKKHKWNQLFSFFDDSICNYQKRGVEEGETSYSKQFRSLV